MGNIAIENNEVTRESHLKWCKDRALEYVNQGDLANAIASMTSDMGKNPGTSMGLNGGLALVAMMYVQNNDVEGVRRWVEGFN